RASGASIRTRLWAPGRSRRSIESARPIRASTTMRSCAPTSSDGCRDGGRDLAPCPAQLARARCLPYDACVQAWGGDVGRELAAALYAGRVEPCRAGRGLVSVRQAWRGAEVRHAVAL